MLRLLRSTTPYRTPYLQGFNPNQIIYLDEKISEAHLNKQLVDQQKLKSSELIRWIYKRQEFTSSTNETQSVQREKCAILYAQINIESKEIEKEHKEQANKLRIKLMKYCLFFGTLNLIFSPKELKTLTENPNKQELVDLCKEIDTKFGDQNLTREVLLNTHAITIGNVLLKGHEDEVKKLQEEVKKAKRELEITRLQASVRALPNLSLTTPPAQPTQATTVIVKQK